MAFRDCLLLRMTQDATSVADELFRESFAQDFPTPRVIRYSAIEVHPEDWRQAFALYCWPDGREECVGFVNWIKFRNAYLGGALCVKKDFYRRLSREHFQECRLQGGVAQIMLEFCERTLSESSGWFAYCGDTKSLRVNLRVGFVETEYPFILVKWINPPVESERRALTAEIATLGPF